VVELAGATRAALFAEEDGGAVVVTVRDDGRGFSYDERRLLAEGKIGLAKSVRGRVEELGGTMTVTSRRARAPRSSCGSRPERTSGTAEEDKVRVMVVDDHPVWRDGVRADLEASGRVEVVAEAADGGDAIEQAREAMAELVLKDLNLPTVPGVDAIRRIVEESPHVKVLVL
jgi:PleD family two-component response regulator